jgi:tRNA-Thr(GGU) m(6)t(6)A37 methyltransferase TsaA
MSTGTQVRFLNIELNPIGFVKTELSDEEVKSKSSRDLEAEIEIFDEYAEGLEAIDGFSHLLVLFYLHKVTETQRRLLKARPRRLARYGLNLEGLPLVGVFCLDSPHRPNPIGLSVVKLLWRKGRILRVEGLDAFNETPVLDLKPYSPGRKVEEFKVPKWYENTIAKVKAKGYNIQDF